jgi:hypothetical protein
LVFFVSDIMWLVAPVPAVRAISTPCARKRDDPS